MIAAIRANIIAFNSGFFSTIIADTAQSRVCRFELLLRYYRFVRVFSYTPFESHRMPSYFNMSYKKMALQDIKDYVKTLTEKENG